MKSKKIKIVIKSPEHIRSELREAFASKKKKIQNEDEIVFSSPESFTKILTANRLEILMYLNRHRPKSIYDLAKGLGRDFKNVHTDVKKLSELNLIILEPSEDLRNSVIPKAKYNAIDLSLVA